MDKGYNGDYIVTHIENKSIEAIIRSCKNRNKQREYGLYLYRYRYMFDNAFLELKKTAWNYDVIC